MSEIVISEVYVSAVDQQINGRIYMAGEVVPDAHAIPTLAALLRTNRMRQHSTATPLSTTTPEEAPEDLGTEEARPPRAKKAKRTRKRTKRARKGATAVR